MDISSELWAIDDGKFCARLFAKRKAELPCQERAIFVSAVMSATQTVFVFRDAEPGDWIRRRCPTPEDPANLDRGFGRDLLLINAFMDAVAHNKTGCEITMLKRRIQ